MDMDVQQALLACENMKKISSRLQILQDLGLGYLTLGEATPSLSMRRCLCLMSQR